MKRYYLDFETNTCEISMLKTSISLWCVKSPKEDPIVNVGPHTFWKWLESLKKSAHIYAHFGSEFDYWFILSYALNNGFQIESEYQMLTTDRVISLFVQGKRIYRMKIYFSERNIITFNCTGLLTLTSLANLGVAVGYPKKPGKKWFDYWGYLEKKDKHIYKFRRLQKNPNAKFEYFSTLEEFDKKNQKYCKRNIDCDCFKCYIIRDVVILEYYMEKFLLDKSIKIGMTIGSTSMNTFRHWLSQQEKTGLDRLRLFGSNNKNKSNFRQPLTVEEMRFFLNSFAGGHVDFNEKYFNKINKVKYVKGISFDVNSLYPSVMQFNPIACGGLYSSKPLYGNSVKIYQIRIFELKLKEKYPPIFAKKLLAMSFNNVDLVEGVNKQKVYAFTSKKGAIINIWAKELDYYLKCYFINFEILHTFWVKTTKVFNRFIKLLSKKKLNAENMVERNVAKLLMNNNYGKWGERIERTNTLIIDISRDFDWDKFDNDLNFDNYINERTKAKIIKAIELFNNDTVKYYDWVKKRKDLVFLNGKKTILKTTYFKKMREDYRLKTVSAGTASYIAMLSRCVLFEVLLANRKNWLYCDTDSVYIDGKVKNIAIDDKKIGHWKQELKFNKIKVIEAKKYMLNVTHQYLQNEKTMQFEWINNNVNKIVCAGIKIMDEKPSFSQFEKGKEHSELQNLRKFVEGGILLVPIHKKY